jgi:dUTPase
MIIIPGVRVEVEEVSSLGPTSRVTGGFGSTGIAANV